MSDVEKKGLAVLLGFPKPDEPKPNPRKAAIQRLKEALKNDDDDAIDEALQDYMYIKTMDE